MLMFTRSASRCRYNNQTSLLLSHTRKTQVLWQLIHSHETTSYRSLSKMLQQIIDKPKQKRKKINYWCVTSRTFMRRKLRCHLDFLQPDTSSRVLDNVIYYNCILFSHLLLACHISFVGSIVMYVLNRCLWYSFVIGGIFK